MIDRGIVGNMDAPPARPRPHLGPNPPAALAEIRRDSFAHMLASTGTPPSLFEAAADGTAQGKAVRRWHLGTVLPLARILEAELAAKLEGDVRRAAFTMNERFPAPLDEPEVEGILRSVLRRRTAWMLHGWHSEGFRTKQGARGRLSGTARRRTAAESSLAVGELLSEGKTYREIAEALGVGLRTVKRYLAATRREGRSGGGGSAPEGRRECSGGP